jgi:glycosyltransferase involved in cell wall biosynthesis
MVAVSVVIPAYNAARFLPAAVDSVLGQSFRDFEVLVVDDGSTDDTESVISQYRDAIRYLRQENRGVAEARNRGIGESNGRYVAFLDADDTWSREKLHRQMKALEASRGRRVCYCAFEVRTETLELLSVQRSAREGPVLYDLLLRGNVVGTPSTVVCDRSLFSVVGGFDPYLSQCADWDMWIRLATVTEFLYLDESLVTYRQHRANMSRDPRLLERDSLRVLEKGFSLSSLRPSVRAARPTAFGRNYMVLAGTYFHAGRYGDFLRCALRAVPLDPWQLGYLAGLPGRIVRRRWQYRRPRGSR